MADPTQNEKTPQAQGQVPQSPHPAERSNAARVAVAIVAALVIAFCGWSAATYAQGGDPLAFLGGSAFQTTAEDDASASKGASLKLKSTTHTVTSDDVKAQIAKLAYGDRDLALGVDEVGVIVNGTGIWVENASGADAAQAIDDAAFRAAALAKWARKQKVGFRKVVWIQEDMAGNVRVALTYPTSRASKGETAAQILAGCTGYAVSGDAYAALSNPGFVQSAGKAPQLPDGNAVTVIAEASSQGEVLTSDGQTYSVLSTGSSSTGESGSGASSGSSASSGSAGSNSGSGSKSSGASSTSNGSSSSSSSSSSSNGSANTGGNSSSSQTQSGISVAISVDASAVGAGSSSATVQLAEGATVYDALKATGVAMNAQNTQYGIYVSAIGGLAEKEHGSSSGWMYSVNGVTPMTACSNYKLSNGDKVVWYYVTGD